MSTLYYGASMPRHIAVICGRKGRAQVVSVHDESDVDTVGEPFQVLAPWVVLVPQPSPKPPTAMKAVRLIGVYFNDMIERERCRMGME